VVNASGPWFDAVAARIERPHAPRVRMTKGIHIACEPFTTHALILESAVDGRVVFAIPWSGYTWVGTTDTDFEGDPATAEATAKDVQYLIDSLAPHLPAIRSAKQHWTCAGVRALVREEGSESEVSRMHQLATDTPGLISVIGGKLTGYRAIAEEVVDAVCGQLGHAGRSTTSTMPLPGTSTERVGLARHELAPQVVFAARHEWCQHLADFMLRRSDLGFRPMRGLESIDAVAQLMQRELGWPDARRLAETDAYTAWVGRHQRALAVPAAGSAVQSGTDAPAPE
jgi:glycerol-3-phosphate dehydrogenase